MNLIFDYDGTLHDCMKIYGPAFRRAYAHLVALSLAEDRAWQEHEISQWLGVNPKEMWVRFMPSLPQRYKEECSQIVGEETLRLVREGHARLYPQAQRVLETLRQSHTLIFLSNCNRAYLRANREQFRLEQYFSAFYCAEEFGYRPKHEIFSAIKEAFPGEFVVIGDRFHDMEIARKHGLKAIGCAYGYGKPQELAGADFIASSVEEILDFRF